MFVLSRYAGIAMSVCTHPGLYLMQWKSAANLTRVACGQHAKCDLVLSAYCYISWELQSKQYISLTLWQADGHGHRRDQNNCLHWRDLILKMVASITICAMK